MSRFTEKMYRNARTATTGMAALPTPVLVIVVVMGLIGLPMFAIKAYEALAAGPGFDPAFKDFAKLRAAMLRLDSDDPLEFERRFAPLASDSFPYHHQIRELLGLAALKRNAFDSAANWFDGIVSDTRAPAGVHMRAQALLGLVQSAAVGPANAPAGNPPPGDAPAK